MIRKSNSSDINVIMDIWLETNILAHNFVPNYYWKNNYEGVKQAIQNAEVYVWEQNDRICGFVGLVDNYIAGIFVKQDFQSNGIGAKMLSYVKSIKEQLTLNVYVNNRRAVAFYKKNGFHIDEKKVDDDTGQEEYSMSWAKAGN